MAYALTMMHRTDEAAAMLAKAEPANDSEEYLHAGAMLSAVTKDADAANQAVSKLTKLHPALGDEVAKHVRLILDGTHIHFFPRRCPRGFRRISGPGSGNRSRSFSRCWKRTMRTPADTCWQSTSTPSSPTRRT